MRTACCLCCASCFDQHASQFGESPGRVCSKHGHDSAPVVEAERDERVLVGDRPLEFHRELVSVEHPREQLHVVGSYWRPGEDHDAVWFDDECADLYASWGRAMVFLLSLYRRGGREWSGRRKSRLLTASVRLGAMSDDFSPVPDGSAEQDAAHVPRDRTPLGGRRRTRPSVKPVACGRSGVSPRRPRLTSVEGSYSNLSWRSRRGTAGRSSEPERRPGRAPRIPRTPRRRSVAGRRAPGRLTHPAHLLDANGHLPARDAGEGIAPGWVITRKQLAAGGSGARVERSLRLDPRLEADRERL